MLTIDLTEKVALVLGGSRGIGAGIVEALARAGASTFFTHTGNPQRREQVESLLARIENGGGRAEAIICDGCDVAGTNRVVNDIAGEHGTVDILVPNVGQNLPGPAEDVTDDQWRQFIDVNLTTAFYGVRAVLPHMLNARSGRIILIGSSVVYDGGGDSIEYASGKAALGGMMRYLVKNYARKGILTNIIHPCVIDTDLLRQRYDDKEKRERLAAQVPVGRLGQPADIAALVAYLASPHGDFVCGQEILVDGGRTFFR